MTKPKPTKPENRIGIYNTITLQGFIDALEEWIVLAEKDAGGAAKAKDCSVYFDWAMATPTDLDSYRGYYSELALGYESESGDMTVGRLLKELKGAIGKTYHGWKGGEYTMTRKSSVFVGNTGHGSGTVILGIQSETYAAIIRTGDEI